VPLWEWIYNNPRHTSIYYRNYCFGERNTCSKGGLPPFPSPHPMTNGYLYHKKWLLDFDGRCHYWPDSHRYGSMSIDDDNTCNDDGCSGEDIIICQMNTRWWLHSPRYWDIWVFSFPFRFISDHLCTNHYHVSLTIFFNPLNVCFILSTTCVHSHVTSQAISILQHVAALGQGASSLPHIINSAPPSLVDMWQMTTLSF
jgi:hypothetical protein